MNQLVAKAIEILDNPEHFDTDGAVELFLNCQRGLYMSDLRQVPNGFTILTVARTLISSAKILLDGWKYDTIDIEHGSIMATFGCIHKMAEVLEQFNDFLYAMKDGKDYSLKVSNLRATILNVEAYHMNLFNVDLVKMSDEMKFAFLAADAGLSEAFHKIDQIIDKAVGRG